MTTDRPISGQAMTRPEPAGAGTAEMIAHEWRTERDGWMISTHGAGNSPALVYRAVGWKTVGDAQFTGDIDACEQFIGVQCAKAVLLPAITAAESRAMERCAKMADKHADHSEAAAEQFDDMAKRQSNDDDYFRLALTRRRIAGDMRLLAKGIRSSINPPGEEE